MLKKVTILNVISGFEILVGDRPVVDDTETGSYIRETCGTVFHPVGICISGN